ncbi:hypothetical protein NX059_011991 [Plenodomus lindquistii]|nr:hypothetical protein NX059_011991 [Plenodomus lindquistii]
MGNTTSANTQFTIMGDTTSVISPTGNAPALPYIPTELWIAIIKHTDARTLWHTLRPVSHMHRVEVEREMKCFRLPKLRFKWRYPFNDPREPGICSVARLSHFSDDEDRVYFDLKDGLATLHSVGVFSLPVTIHDAIASLGHTQPPQQSMEIIHGRLQEMKCEAAMYRLEDIRKQLTYVERGPATLRHYSLDMDRSVVFEGYVRQVEMPGLQIDFDTAKLSFEWKPFLADFLAADALARSLERRKNMTMARQVLWDQAWEEEKKRARNRREGRQ